MSVHPCGGFPVVAARDCSLPAVRMYRRDPYNRKYEVKVYRHHRSPAAKCECGQACVPLDANKFRQESDGHEKLCPDIVVIHCIWRMKTQTVEIHPQAPADGSPLTMVPEANLQAFTSRLLHAHCPDALRKVCYVQQDRVLSDVRLPCIRITFSCLTDVQTFLHSTAGGITLNEFDDSMTFATAVPDRRLSGLALTQPGTDPTNVMVG